MNGVILMREGKRATVLRDDGVCETLPAAKGWQVGMEVELPENKAQASHKRIFPVALAACLALVVGVGGFSYLNAPTSYVDIVINPAVRLKVNRLSRVNEWVGINADGKELLSQVKLNGDLYEDVNIILEQARVGGFLTETDSQLRIAVSSDKNETAQAMETQLLALAAGTVGQDTNIQVQKIPSDVYSQLSAEVDTAAQSDANVQLDTIYRTSIPKSAQNMMLEEIEYRGSGKLELEFSSDGDWDGTETVALNDQNGNTLAAESLWQDEDEWLVRTDSIQEGAIYSLTVTSAQYGTLTGSFRANPGEESKAEDATDNSWGAEPLPAEVFTPPENMQIDYDAWISELEYRKNGRLEAEIEGQTDGLYFQVLDESGNSHPVDILSADEDEFDLRCDTVEGKRYILQICDADGLLVSEMPFDAVFGFEAERKTPDGYIETKIDKD